MSNISSIKSGHKKSLLQPKITKYGCNCSMKNYCPLQNKCQTPNLIYRTDVENEVNNETKIHFGIAFKKRSGIHEDTHIFYLFSNINIL